MGRRRSRKMPAADRKNLLGTAVVSGGIAGVAAMVLAVWMLIDWFDMDCGFFDSKNCSPPSTSELKDWSDMQTWKFIVAWIIVLPSLISFITGVAGMKKAK